MSETEIPADLHYTAEHEWIRKQSDGTVVIGITAYAQDALGDVVFVQLPEAGATVAAGDAVGEIESTKSVSDLYAPVAGTIEAVNDALDGAPELVNSDPYGEGWMFRMRPDAELGDLLDADGYRASIG